MVYQEKLGQFVAQVMRTKHLKCVTSLKKDAGQKSLYSKLLTFFVKRHEFVFFVFNQEEAITSRET